MTENHRIQIGKINPNWSLMVALEKKGFYSIKSLEHLLQVDFPYLLGVVNNLKQKGVESGVFGIVKHEGLWLVQMEVFGDWYLQNVHNKVIRRPAPCWDGNTLLQQSGLFLLADVCRLLPFTSAQLRHQIKKSSDSRKEYGIWKATDASFNGAYLVDMTIFAPFIRKVWQNHEPGPFDVLGHQL